MRTLALVAPLCLLAPASIADDLNEQLEMLASDGEGSENFGASVAVEGGTVVIGALFDDDLGDLSGSAYLFDATTGLEQAKLLAADGAAFDFFGSSVGLAGSTVIVGCMGDDALGSSAGAVYLFDRATGAQTAKLQAADGEAFDFFGSSVAIHGTLAVVGADGADEAAVDSGAAYLFDTSTGAQLAKLLPDDGAEADFFGNTVALSATWAMIGAYGDDDLGEDSGSVYVFELATGLQVAKLLPSDGEAYDYFGNALAIDGETALVGAWGDDDAGSAAGAAYLFDVATGKQLAKLTASDGGPDHDFGTSVALSAGVALVGAVSADAQGASSGAAYLFEAATGAETARLLPSDGAAGDRFAVSVALESGAAVVGAHYTDDNGPQAGSAYVFGAPGSIGEGYCGPAQLNSSGAAATLGAWGSTEVAANLVRLDAADMPPSVPGMFLNSRTEGFVVPPGSQGALCLGGSIGRYTANVLSTGAAGAFSLALDLTDTPTPAGPVAIQPGETWRFQAWFRDKNPGPTSNFTDGVRIRFE